VNKYIIELGLFNVTRLVCVVEDYLWDKLFRYNLVLMFLHEERKVLSLRRKQTSVSGILLISLSVVNTRLQRHSATVLEGVEENIWTSEVYRDERVEETA
jgi:hypothetical protein